MFVLKLGMIQNDSNDGTIFHFEIDEKTPLKPRYRVTEDLKPGLSFKPISFYNTSRDITIYSNYDNNEQTAVVQLLPFQIDFTDRDGVILSVNSKDLMRFEHLRTKPSSLDPNEDSDSWEEAFRGVIDIKPNGPEALGLDFTFPKSEVLFGIPEHADSFALKSTIDGEPYRLFNLDVYRFELDSPMALYGSVPVIYSAGSGGSYETVATGVFWHNSADTFVDIHNNKTVHFMSEAGIIDVFVFMGPGVSRVFSQYTFVTGVAKLPPIYSLGYHQSRWNYFTQQEVLDVVDNFDKNNLQLDTIWLDIEYTDGKRYFTWDKEAFPNPLGMISELNKTGRHLTFIIDPHTKVDDNYFFYSNNSVQQYFVKNNNGSVFEGNCWPGMSSYVDFFNPEAQKYYADQYLLENFADSSIETGVWNDMNEPSVFDVPEITMPRDNIHHGGWEHRNVHNQYGLMQTKGTFDGVLRRSDGHLRPFILTRSFFSGSQRYAAVWTGDNTADWGYLRASVKMCLSLSVAGISFCGSDVGGFFDDPEEELFVRWFQAGAFQPFFRSHSETTTTRREPYLLPEPSMAIVREAIRKRYALLQFWYTKFFEHERSGSPVMRPMLYSRSDNPDLFYLDNQYFIGNELLVRPVMEKGVDRVNVYFPKDIGGYDWFDFDDYRRISEIGFQPISVNDEKIPVYQKGGTIIPVKETVRKSSEEMVDDPISFFITVHLNRASGTLYIDDGKSYDYRNENKYLYLYLELIDDRITITKIDEYAHYETNVKVGRIVIAGYNKDLDKVRLETADGVRTDLEIIKSENFFEIKTSDLSLTGGWKIILNGAGQNILCATLALAVLMIHVSKYL